MYIETLSKPATSTYNSQQKSNKSNNSLSSTSSTNKTKQNINLIAISDHVLKIQSVLNEFSEILGQFHLMSKTSKSVDAIQDIFEALNYELNVRIQDTRASLNSIQLLERELYQQLIFKIIKNHLNKSIWIPQKLSQEGILGQLFFILIQNIETYKEIQNLITQSLNQAIQILDKQTDFEDEYGEMEKFDSTKFYDWVLDVDLFKNLSVKGWKITYGFEFERQKLFQNKTKIEGANVAVLGLYDKGKTFILNHLTQQNLPSGKKFTTKGLSFKHVRMDSGTSLVLVDTAGSYSPVRIDDKQSIADKEITEQFILDLVFEISDYFICVVNDFTSLDQRYLDRLARKLQNSTKSFKEIIVIHNMKEIDQASTLNYVWNSQVTQIYSTGGSVQKTKVAAISPFTKELQEKQVLWFKTQFTRHICLVNDNTSLGKSVNPWVLSLVKYWLKSVFIPLNRRVSIIDSVLKQCELKVSSYLKKSVQLEIKETHNQYEQIVVQKQVEQKQKVQAKPVVANGISQNKIIQNISHKFEPLVDISANHKYIILIDLPGVSIDDLEISRQNLMTIIRGFRRNTLDQDEQYIRQERKFGDFEMNFKIPQEFDRKWNSFSLENGVLKIEYLRDEDDFPNKHN